MQTQKYILEIYIQLLLLMSVQDQKDSLDMMLFLLQEQTKTDKRCYK